MDAYNVSPIHTSLVCAAETAMILAVVSGTKMLAADPLHPVGHKVGPPQIRLVCTARSTDTWLDRDLGNLEAFPYCILVPNKTHTHTHISIRRYKKNVIHQSRSRPPLSSMLMLIVVIFGGGLGSAWASCLACNNAASYSTNFTVIWRISFKRKRRRRRRTLYQGHRSSINCFSDLSYRSWSCFTHASGSHGHPCSLVFPHWATLKSTDFCRPGLVYRATVSDPTSQRWRH